MGPTPIFEVLSYEVYIQVYPKHILACSPISPPPALPKTICNDNTARRHGLHPATEHPRFVSRRRYLRGPRHGTPPRRRPSRRRGHLRTGPLVHGIETRRRVGIVGRRRRQRSKGREWQQWWWWRRRGWGGKRGRWGRGGGQGALVYRWRRAKGAKVRFLWCGCRRAVCG